MLAFVLQAQREEYLQASLDHLAYLSKQGECDVCGAHVACELRGGSPESRRRSKHQLSKVLLAFQMTTDVQN